MALFNKDGLVLTCRVDECSYNDAETCRAWDIRVGSSHAIQRESQVPCSGDLRGPPRGARGLHHVSAGGLSRA